MKDDSIIFHAGTSFKNDKMLLMGQCGFFLLYHLKTMKEALKKSYKSIDKIKKVKLLDRILGLIYKKECAVTSLFFSPFLSYFINSRVQ